MSNSWADKAASGQNLFTALQRIERMNNVFNLDWHTTLEDLGEHRLTQFRQVFSDELDELKLVYTQEEDGGGNTYKDFDRVQLADTFTDLLIYLLSECCRWGVPIFRVFNIVMDSQDSKLVNGEALMSEDGSKFIKGPNYEPPEDRIEAFLNRFE